MKEYDGPWISLKERTPESGLPIKIKADYEGIDPVEGEAILTITLDDTEVWAWKITSGYKSTLRPTHFKPKRVFE